jgi:hypothetical protein
MSGFIRPRWAGIPSRMNLPRFGVVADGPRVNVAFTAIESADAQNLKTGVEPRVPSILMQASDGSTWRFWLKIDSPGQQPSPRFTLVEPKEPSG